MTTIALQYSVSWYNGLADNSRTRHTGCKSLMSFRVNTALSPRCFTVSGNDSKSCGDSALLPELFEPTWQTNQFRMVLLSLFWTRHSATVWTMLRLGVSTILKKLGQMGRKEWVGLLSARDSDQMAQPHMRRTDRAREEVDEDEARV